MRLAIFEPSPHGGLLHYAVQLGDALAGRGHAVDLLTVRGNELAAREGPARMRATLTPPVRSAAAAPGGVAYLLRRVIVGGRLLRCWAEVAREILRCRYDAVILNPDFGLVLTALAALALTRLPRRPALASVCHNVRPFNRWAGEELFSSSPVLLGLLRQLFPRLDLVLVHGERSREEFESTWPPTRLAVIPHGDERLFVGAEPPPPADEERVLFFGDWRKVKGLEVLTEAFDVLAKHRPDARLTIAGTPAPADLDPERIRRWAATHGERVKIVDQYVPVEDVRELFAEARVVVTPYLAGYQSGVVHLAMTMGRAVVASDVGDLGSVVVDRETGRLVPPGEAASLATALDELLGDRLLIERLGAEGRRRVLRGSSWEAVAKRVEAALQSVVETESAAP